MAVTYWFWAATVVGIICSYMCLHVWFEFHNCIHADERTRYSNKAYHHLFHLRGSRHKHLSLVAWSVGFSLLVALTHVLCTDTSGNPKPRWWTFLNVLVLCATWGLWTNWMGTKVYLYNFKASRYKGDTITGAMRFHLEKLDGSGDSWYIVLFVTSIFWIISTVLATNSILDSKVVVAVLFLTYLVGLALVLWKTKLPMPWYTPSPIQDHNISFAVDVDAVAAQHRQQHRQLRKI
jgi:hypothetical protein